MMLQYLGHVTTLHLIIFTQIILWNTEWEIDDVLWIKKESKEKKNKTWEKGLFCGIDLDFELQAEEYE